MSQSKHRILFLIDVLGMGGAERLLVPILDNLSSEKYETRVCVFREKYGNPIATRIRELGIPVDLLPVKHLRDVSAIPRLVKYCRNHKIDLIHAQLDFASTLGGFVSKFMRLPAVSTIHTLPTIAEDFRGQMRQKLLWYSQEKFYDRIIAVADGASKHYLSVSGTSPEKMVTIYNGIELEKYAPPENFDQHKLRHSLGLPQDAHILITVAMLRQKKGIQYMFNALVEIIEQIPNTYYLVVGTGDYQESLISLAKELGLQEHVVFTGMRQDIPELLAISNIFVLPTLTEALPTVLAEAMAAQKAIIACEVGGVPEMIKNEQSGLLIPPADADSLVEACLTLLENPEKQRAMAQAGWQIVNQKFSIQSQVGNLEALYDELLGAYER